LVRYGSEVLISILLLAVAAASLYGYSIYKKYSAIYGALEAAKQAVEYEPLSHAGDGSYAEEESRGRSSKVLDRLRSWRGSH